MSRYIAKDHFKYCTAPANSNICHYRTEKIVSLHFYIYFHLDICDTCLFQENMIISSSFLWHRVSSKSPKSWSFSHMQQSFCQSLTGNLLIPWQMLLFAGIELYFNLTYAKYLFITSLWLDVIAISWNVSYGTTP